MGIDLLLGIQARTTSTRFPGKINADINGTTMLDRIYLAAKQALIGQVVILVPHNNPVQTEYHPFEIWEGPEDDVLTRYHGAAHAFEARHIMRLTSDCPLISEHLITESWAQYKAHPVPYWCNRDYCLPDGWDLEIFTRSYLDIANAIITDPLDREHCVFYFNKYKDGHYSVDHEGDLEQIRTLAKKF